LAAPVSGSLAQLAVDEAAAAEADSQAQQAKQQVVLAEHLSAKYKKPYPRVRQIVQTAYAEAARHGLPPLLILAIIEKESSFREQISNSYGAMGLMQVVPRFHREKLSNPVDDSELLTYSGNIRVGTQILAEYLRWKRGNVERALVKYSGNATAYYSKVMQHKAELREVVDSRMQDA